MEEYFRAYLVCIEALLHIENNSKFQFVHMAKFNRLGSIEECSVHDIKTVSLSFLVTFAASFDASNISMDNRL